MIRHWLAAMCLSATITVPLHAESRGYGLTVEFEPGAVEPLPGKHGGSVDEMAFAKLELPGALLKAGVVRLQRIFPEFRPEDRFTRNRLGEPVILEDLSKFYSVSIDTKDFETAAGRLLGIAGIRSVSVNRLGSFHGIPNDPNFVYQWWLHDTEGDPQDLACTTPEGISDVDVNGPEAWDLAIGSPAVRVAIIDSGIDSTHDDLYGAVTIGRNFGNNDCGTGECDVVALTCGNPHTEQPQDTKLHGTGVAGIVGARTNNGIGVAGIGGGVSLVSYKNDTPCCSGYLSCWSAEAIAYATAAEPPIMIMNMSYGGGFDPAERGVAKNAFLMGRLLVGTMGNNNMETRLYPAAYERFVCAVGAIQDNGQRWVEGPSLGSNWGSWIDLSAPGGNKIVTTRRTTAGPYYTCDAGFGGTSAAAPVVAGVAALLLSAHPELEGEDLQQVMSRTARDVVDGAGNGWDIYTGHGLVRADAALRFLALPRQIYHGSTASLSTVASDPGLTVEFRGVGGLQSATYQNVTRHRLRGVVSLPASFESAPDAWTRSSGTQGARDTGLYDEPEEAPWGDIVSFTADQVEVETFVYQVPLPAGGSFWVPCTPQEATVAITAVGGEPPTGGGCEPYPGPGPPPDWWCGGEILSPGGQTKPSGVLANGTTAWYDIAGRKLDGPRTRGVYFTRTFRDGKWGVPKAVVVK